ncbi:MAG: 2,3-bisphosphoglycerate-independent phosphoglycerate mutase [Elusimicrobiota bacterium]
MDQMELIKRISRQTDSRIVFLIMDGLGGLGEPGGKTELETAKTPNLDALAARSSCGLADPVAPGITPGSGPAHLALFGYDPVRYNIGRGMLEALGIDFPVKPGDVAIRINFCTVDDGGVITDRRAGRIPTEKCVELCAKLDKIEVDGVDISIRPVKEYRAAMVLRGGELGGALNDTDPQVTGKRPLPLSPGDGPSERTAKIVNAFMEKAEKALKDDRPANMMLLRGFALCRPYPSMADLYKLKSAAIAQYPMYKGLARMLGMDVLDAGDKKSELFDVLEKRFKDYTYFYVHVKKTDSAGEDGDFARKVSVIEETDALIPRLTALEPDVIVITGDHSTPARLKSHSWHPLPFLLHSRYCRVDEVKEFGETACARGGMGRLPSTALMPLAMANALKLDKFGA